MTHYWTRALLRGAISNQNRLFKTIRPDDLVRRRFAFKRFIIVLFELSQPRYLGCVRIPTKSAGYSDTKGGHLFRSEAGHHSDLMAAGVVRPGGSFWVDLTSRGWSSSRGPSLLGKTGYSAICAARRLRKLSPVSLMR
jgi:hypothetical protein